MLTATVRANDPGMLLRIQHLSGHGEQKMGGQAYLHMRSECGDHLAKRTWYMKAHAKAGIQRSWKEH